MVYSYEVPPFCLLLPLWWALVRIRISMYKVIWAAWGWSRSTFSRGEKRLDGLHSSIFISISSVIQLVYLQFHSVDGNLDDGECEVARSANTISITLDDWTLGRTSWIWMELDSCSCNVPRFKRASVDVNSKYFTCVWTYIERNMKRWSASNHCRCLLIHTLLVHMNANL